MGYAQAIYETGARGRTTSKNLLRSLRCFRAANQVPNPAEVADLLASPVAADRRPPEGNAGQIVAAGCRCRIDRCRSVWWSRLRDRYAHAAIVRGVAERPGRQIPEPLFDSVAENLSQNALAKRQRGQALVIEACLDGAGLGVADSGSPIPSAVMRGCCMSRSSERTGWAMFYHCLQAAELGYQLSVAENQPGRGPFRLSPAPWWHSR